MPNSQETTQEPMSRSAIHETSTAQSSLLEIKRDFCAPVSRLFDAFRSPETLKIWWWPKGLHADHVDLDFRVGGSYFINMKGYDQGGGGMTGRFEEITENKRLVMSDHFADADGKPISAKDAKMPGVWPEVIYITLEFESIGENKSRLVLSQEGIPNEVQKDCRQGWNESFDKLETFLNDGLQ